jgi:hypothetical protein
VNDMRRRFLTKLMLLVLFLTVFSAIFSPETLAGTTILYIDPPQIAGLTVGDTFQINVTISDVIDLYGWQFSLYYRGDILNATDVTDGPFLKNHPDTDDTVLLTPIFTDSYNATHGLIIASSTLVEVEGGVSGSGALATVTFKIKETGSSILHLTGTKLVDSATPFGNLIPHTTEDGEVHWGVRDVAVVDVEISATKIYEGHTLSIDVVVVNNGDHTETFSVTTYYDSNIISSQPVHDLAPSSQSTLTFLWDTTGVDPDIYAIKAEAEAVPGETNLGDNVLIDGVVTVRSYAISLVKIAHVVPSNQSGYPATGFELGSMGYFKVTVNNTSSELETVLVTVNVYDSSDTTLGVVSFKGMIMPSVSTFILGLPISSTASSGSANVYVNAFTDWPYFGGIPYCPEVSATFTIESP